MESRFSRDQLHRLLIRAALDKGKSGKRSFERWKNKIKLTDIDYPSQKMLSAVGHHLAEDEVSRQVLKVAKFTWLRSQMLLQAGFRAEDALRNCGIPVVWIKGAAVLARTSTEVANRQMEDIDLLIPVNQVSMAARCLQQAGFRSSADRELANEPRLITHNTHAIAFKDPTGAEVDLHWQAFKETAGSEDEQELWQRASEAVLINRKTTVISQEDLFVQVIATNREGNDAHWVLDASKILEDNEIDFGLVVDIARTRKLLFSCFVAFSIILSFKPRLIPAKYWALATISEIADYLNAYLLKNPLVRNFVEILNLWPPKLISFAVVEKLIPATKLLVTNREVIIGNEEKCLSFGSGILDQFRNPLATTNWHQAEESGTWSSDRFATVELIVPNQARSLKVKAIYSVIGSRFAMIRRVAIYVNGERVQSKLQINTNGRQQESEFRVNRSDFTIPITLTFFVSSTLIPRQHKMNMDQRRLGLFLQKILISGSDD
jgi:hypothetical protein